MIVAIIFLAIFIVGSQSAEWSHNDQDNWPGICQSGRFQSPINIPKFHRRRKVKTSPMNFQNYLEPLRNLPVENDGHTIVINPDLPHHRRPSISQGGLPGKYNLAQFHFHWGSEDDIGAEHTIEGRSYPIELHLVHLHERHGLNISEALVQGRPDGLAVLGIFFEIQDENNPVMEKLIQALERKQTVPELVMANLLPRNTQSFYRYQGSLTTPGCQEVVIWTLFKDTIGISRRQLHFLRQLMDGQGKKLVDNFRSVQDLNKRPVLDVETSTTSFQIEKPAKVLTNCQPSLRVQGNQIQQGFLCLAQ